MRKKLIYYLIFTISGASAILYEILWVKILSLAFGGVVLTASLVAGLFLAGLAIGAFLAGKAIDRVEKKKLWWWIYGGVEMIVAILGIVNLIIFQNFTKTLEIWNYPMAGLLIIVQAMVIGATWPLMFKILTFLGSSWRISGLLSFYNTLGGALGAFLGGFLLIANFGISNTLILAVSGNIFAAVGLLLLGILKPDVSSYEVKTEIERSGRSEVSLFKLLPAVFSGGLMGMALEIVWMRSFAQVVGGSVYTFSLVLCAILLGLSLGGLCIYLLKGIRLQLSSLAWILALEGIVILLGAIILPKLPFLVADWHFQQNDFFSIQMTDFLLIFVIVFLPGFFSGMVLPLGINLLKHDFIKAGRGAGLIYFVNTLGAVFGGILAAMVLIPVLGLKISFILIGISIYLIGLWLVFHKKAWIKNLLALGLIALIGFGVWVGWDVRSLALGGYVYGKQMLAKNSPSQLIYYRDGKEATVGITWNNGVTSLRISGKADASNDLDMATQIFLGQIPVLLHQNPKNVLVIGLGSGITAGSALTDDRIKDLAIVEIESGVAETAEKYFNQENYNVLKNPKAHLFIGDARNYLLKTSQKFDVITAEPSNPWMAGINNLFTREYFELGKKRLKDNGIFFQWLHLYSIKPAEIKSIIYTFRSVFPNMQIWTSTAPVDIFLVGRLNDQPFDLGEMEKVFKEEKVKNSLSRIGILSLSDLLVELWTTSQNSEFGELKVEINTDDKPIIEYRAPLGVYLETRPDNFSFLLSLFEENPLHLQEAGEEINKKRQINKLLVEANKSRIEGNLDSAIVLGEKALNINQFTPAKYFLAEIYLDKAKQSIKPKESRRKKNEEAIKLLNLAIEYRPDYYWAYLDLAEKYLANRQQKEAEKLLERAKDLFPWSGSVLMYRGIIAGSAGQYEQSEQLFLEAIQKEPWNNQIYNNLAHLYQIQKKNREAMKNLEKSLSLDPKQANILEQYKNLAKTR